MGVFDKLKNTISSLVNLDDDELYEDANNFPDEIVENEYAIQDKKLTKKGQKNQGNMAIPTFIKNNTASPFQNSMQHNMQSPFGSQMPNMQQQAFQQNGFPQQMYPNNAFQQQDPSFANQGQFGQQMQMPQFANQPNMFSGQNQFNQQADQIGRVQQTSQQASPFMQSLEAMKPNQMQKMPQNNMQATFSGQKSDNIKKFDPQTFEEVQEIAVLIKNGGTAIINLEGITYELSMRIIDFLTGLMFAYDGNIKEVQDNVYIASYTQSLDQGFKPMEDTTNKNNPSFTKMYQGGNPFSI